MRLRHLGLLGPRADGKACNPGDAEVDGNEDELVDRVSGDVVDEGRRSADHDRQSEAGPPDVPKVPEQECGRQPDQEEGLGVRDQQRVDERDSRGQKPVRRRSGKRKPSPREQGQHQDRERGKAEPQRRCRSSGRAASENHVKDRHDRQQRDQQVEPERAGEMFDSAHALNVLHPLRSRLLPK
jgi:hypothetical protein